MRDEKAARIYRMLGLAGLAIGAVLFSRIRKRPSLRVQDRRAEGRRSQVEAGESAGRTPEPNHAYLHHHPAVATTMPKVSGSVASPLPPASTRPDDLLPASVERNRSRNDEKDEPGGQMVLVKARTSQALEHTGVAVPKAARHRMHDWIQTGCAVLAVVLVVFFGATLSRRVRALTEAQRSSQSAALASQQLTRTEQRAWVGMMEAVPLPLRPDGGGFSVKVQNTGKTPALDVQFSAVITLADAEKLSNAEASDKGVATPLGTLLPGAAYTTEVLFRTSPEAVRALVKHEQRAVGWLRMTYTDVFQTPHSSRTCFYWYPDLKKVQPCESFQEMN